jgi:DNA polymerase elongation subunit (family B)
MNYITFDIETYSPSDLNYIDTDEFRVSVAGAYISWMDEYVAFMEDETSEFIDLMKEADVIIGYNHLFFDLPVLQKYAPYDLKQLPNYDILKEVEKKLGHRLRLDDLCKATFEDDVKTDSYEVYRHYHKQGKWAELIDYCLNDVRLTENLFRRILAGQELYYYDLHMKKSVILDKPDPDIKTSVVAEEALL